MRTDLEPLPSRSVPQWTTEDMCPHREGEALAGTGPVAEALGGRRPSPWARLRHTNVSEPQGGKCPTSTVHGEVTRQISPTSSCLGAGPGAGTAWRRSHGPQICVVGRPPRQEREKPRFRPSPIDLPRDTENRTLGTAADHGGRARVSPGKATGGKVWETENVREDTNEETASILRTPEC